MKRFAIKNSSHSISCAWLEWRHLNISVRKRFAVNTKTLASIVSVSTVPERFFERKMYLIHMHFILSEQNRFLQQYDIGGKAAISPISYASWWILNARVLSLREPTRQVFFFFRFFWIMRRVWFLDCFSTLRFALKLERSRFCIHEHPGWIPICNIPKEGEKKLWIHMTINNTNFCCLRCIIVFERLAFLKKILSPFKFHLLYTFQNNFPL